ncbi:hypothetical protein TNCV_2196551 [Trichonephila clavipes]|nr:hypothetical protein TNCV_2196551 [Trichonephila clavipes]
MHCHLVYSKFRYLKACSFASFIHTSLLGFGWKRVDINSGLKEPKEHVKEKTREPVTKCTYEQKDLDRWLNIYSIYLQISSKAFNRPTVCVKNAWGRIPTF